MLAKLRRNSAPVVTHPSVLPYRDGNSLSYVPANPMHKGTAYASYSTNLQLEHDWDDTESTMNLISSAGNLSGFETALDEDAIERFTATGRPMPKHHASAWSNLVVGGCAQAPRYLPCRFTDESIIPVVVRLPAAPTLPALDEQPQHMSGERRKSFLGKLKKEKKDKEETKIVWMPRGDYLKFFAKDEMGNHTGTEPKRDWTAEELDREFGRYFKELKPARR